MKTFVAVLFNDQQIPSETMEFDTEQAARDFIQAGGQRGYPAGGVYTLLTIGEKPVPVIAFRSATLVSKTLLVT